MITEIKRLQQLAGILNEIKVNKPFDYSQPITIYREDSDDLTYYDEDFDPSWDDDWDDNKSDGELQSEQMKRWREFISKVTANDSTFRTEVYFEHCENGRDGYGEVMWRWGD